MTVFNLPTPDEKSLQRTASAIKQLAQGRQNGVGTFTLAANQATTTVDAIYCAEGSVIIYAPLTANASAEIGAGTIYVSLVTNQSFTLAHANNAQTDRIFRYIALG